MMMRKMLSFFAGGFLFWETERKRAITELAPTPCQPYLPLWGGMAASRRLSDVIGGMLHPPKTTVRGKFRTALPLLGDEGCLLEPSITAGFPGLGEVAAAMCKERRNRKIGSCWGGR